jgi:hypothetical protein
MPLEPAQQMMQLLTGAWAAQAVSAAATLGVADALHRVPRPCDETAAEVGADAGALYRLLRALSGIGLVEEHDGRTFTLTDLGDLLRTDAPESLRGFAIMIGARWHRRSWTDLAESVRTGAAAFTRLFGDSWQYMSEHPDDAEVFDRAMTAVSRSRMAPAVRAYDFSPFERVVDVGGGHGALLAAALSGHPKLRGVLFDLPHVVGSAGAPLEEAGVADRCELVGGDFFAAVPEGGDVYLLSNIVHDWDDDRAVTILANCRMAMRDGGRVVLCEAVLPEARNTPHPATLIDIEMLVMAPGARQRTMDEYVGLFLRAGLRLSNVIANPDADPFSLVEAVPAG